MHPLMDQIFNAGLVPVVKIDDAARAAMLGKTLSGAGLKVAEITFRTACAEDAIGRMVESCPDLVVGAGTVINPGLAQKAIDAGARFIVSPGLNQATVEYCLGRGVPVIPGVNSPSMIELGLSLGLEVFKFFPAEASGGLAMLDALAGPFGSIKFMPTGGIDLSNLARYAAHPSVLAVGGSWMVKPELIAAEQWDSIRALCAEAVSLMHGFALGHLGINHQDADDAAATAGFLASLGYTLKEGNSSIFAGADFELMKLPYRGSHGHIALRCNNVERALAYFEARGYKGDAETARSEKGRLKAIYLDLELGGFSVHLLRA